MAAPNGKFFIQERLDDGQRATHHESFEQLWETKWKEPATLGIYPFMFGTAKDFEPIVTRMKELDMRPPYDWDAYARVFFPQAEHLTAVAEAAEAKGETEKASEYFLRASAVYRIARFPAPRSEIQREAWERGKGVALKGLSLRPNPTAEVLIPHTNRLPHEGAHIPAFHLLPPSATPTSPVPLLIILTGLDGYRTDLAVWQPGWAALGVATLALEIPGTGDCPADASDPSSPDRLFSSIFAWIGTQPVLDATRTALWAFSTGGFYGIRVAHTHAAQLAGVVALGGGCHHMFSPAWLARVNDLEYPFDLAGTLAHKWGYGSDVSRFAAEAQARFSLLEDGTLDRGECARLLLVNGMDDEIFPVDDYLLACQRGGPKELRLVKDTKHMGEPMSFFVCMRWLYGILGVEGDAGRQLATLPFRPKY